MASLVRHISVDCADPYRLATFWSTVLDAPIHPDDRPGDDEVLVQLPGTGMLFIAVPEAKSIKNRLHLDLQPQDRTRDQEIERLRATGATLIDDRRNPDGSGWAVLTDPEGNEFCVERSAAERTTPTT
ncbi:VOC family protein [Kitasatospora sp. NPDC049258]|uniref:VOC family protein n=1 Tax=Kitasatospora sp. NPDC049258 TaxID=3155394 RepID=UPI0034358D32